MGMRGIIAVEKDKGTYLVTTVQWITAADKSWESFTEGMTVAEKAESAKEFAENITKYNHISYFEYREGANNSDSESWKQEGVVLVGDDERRLVTSELVFEEGGAQIYKDSIRSHPHHQDGQAMIIRKNGKVTFLKPRF